MKTTCFWIIIFALTVFSSCATSHPTSSNELVERQNPSETTEITKSLFSDKSASISEQSIQKILDGHYRLPDELRVAFVNLSSLETKRFHWNDEQYLKAQQNYLDLFSGQFRASSRVRKISTIPDILISSSPTFTGIREAAVRTQSDIVVIYAIQDDIYSKFKFLTKARIKAFATTQLIVLDVRTGLIPFTTIVTRDFEDQKIESDFSESETRFRIKNQAVELTIREIGHQLSNFLNIPS